MEENQNLKIVYRNFKTYYLKPAANKIRRLHSQYSRRIGWEEICPLMEGCEHSKDKELFLNKCCKNPPDCEGYLD